MLRMIRLAPLLLVALGPAPARGGPQPAGAGPDAVATARKLLEGCTTAPTHGGVNFDCGPLAASVSDQPTSGVPLARLEETTLAAMSAGGKLEFGSTRETLTHEGRSWPALRILGRPRGQQVVVFEGRLVLAEVDGQRVRTVMCGAGAGSPRGAACDAILPALLDAGPAPFAGKPPAPTIAGKPVKVPEGCAVVDANVTGFQLQCGEAAMVQYMHGVPGAQLGQLVDLLAAQMQKAIPELTPAPPRACKILGAATSCKVLQGGGGMVLVGAAVAHGEPTLAACAQQAGRGPHPACQLVMSF